VVSAVVMAEATIQVTVVPEPGSEPDAVEEE